jgi:hypothetical protein
MREQMQLRIHDESSKLNRSCNGGDESHYARSLADSNMSLYPNPNTKVAPAYFSRNVNRLMCRRLRLTQGLTKFSNPSARQPATPKLVTPIVPFAREEL